MQVIQPFSLKKKFPCILSRTWDKPFSSDFFGLSGLSVKPVTRLYTLNIIGIWDINPEYLNMSRYRWKVNWAPMGAAFALKGRARSSKLSGQRVLRTHLCRVFCKTFLCLVYAQASGKAILLTSPVPSFTNLYWPNT